MHGDDKKPGTGSSKQWWKSALPECQPQTRVLSAGYDPELSEMSVKVPIFTTSTFLFKTAEEGERFFYLQNHPEARGDGSELGLIYSRMNNPNMEIAEDKLMVFESGAEAAAVLPSGMSAISTMCLALLKPDVVVIYSFPIYGATEHLFDDVLSKFGIKAQAVFSNDTEEYRLAIEKHKGHVAMLFIETPANPSMVHTDIEAIVNLAKSYEKSNGRILVAVDNTFMGPIFQSCFPLGADLVVYSATKFIGGHSDLIGGFVLGKKSEMMRIKAYRSVLGPTTDPFCCWLIARSLETIDLRMRKSAENAMLVAEFLKDHPKVARVIYPGLLQECDPQYSIYKKQCSGPGALISFDIKGGKAEAFRALNAVRVCRLAVSLGGTETLISHPRGMTHQNLPEEMCQKVGLTASLIRISVGLEDPRDIIADLDQALAKI
jgi:methionine-gamma-lyase